MRYDWKLNAKLWSVSNTLEKPSKKETATFSRTNEGGHTAGLVIAALIFLLLALSQLGGCAVDKYVVHRMTCPPKPTLPLVMETELESLSDDAYRRLVERELLLKAYIDQLEVGCKPE